MIFKRWKLVYIIVSVKILVATWNTSGSHEENNIDMYDSEHYVQYNPVAPEYPRLQPYNNEMGTSGIYNGSAMRGSFNIAAPIYQNNSSTPNYPPLQQSYGNEMHGYNAYNNPMMLGSFNTEAPAYQYNPFPPAYPELQQSYRNEACNYNPYNNPIMGGLYNFGIPTSSEPEERVHQREIKTPDIEQLITEMRQTGQNLSSGVRLSEVEYNERITEIINEQESAELNSLANNSEGMPIEESINEQESVESNSSADSSEEMSIEESINEQESVESNSSADSSEEMSIEEPINEYRLYDASEQFLSLVAPLSAEDSLYEYSNFVFLHHFLRSPSPLITADSIRVRFSGQFFFFLAQEQLIRVLIVLLENKLELSNEDQKEFIEMIFGCIDYSSEKIITKEEVVTIVEAMMRSNVPDYFEYVFLTWKMWYSFTIEEQEKMLKNAKKEYKREILVMLYLFVMNRDEDNSQQCEIFKNDVKNQYKEFSILKNGHSLKDIVIKGAGWNDRIFCTILDTFDTCLLDIPEVFKSLDNNTIILFRNFFRIQFFPRYHKYLNFKNLRYRSHTCYALTTFTRELEEVNGIGESNDVETNSRLYFDPLRIKNEFGTWIRMMKKSNNLSGTITVEEYKKVFINAFAIIRQIMHSDNFNYKIFLKIFNNSAFGQYYNRPYVTLLFSLINEGVFDDLTKSQEWAECIDEETGRFYKHQFISDILSVNMGYGRVVDPLDTIKEYITRIHGFLSKLNTKDTIIMHREHFFFQHLLFHPRLNLISGTSILYYMEGLKKIGWANSREKCDQITRDLFFNDYYYEFAMELKNKVAEIENEPWIRKFKESIERELEIYKNEEDIKKERKNFYKC